MASCLKCGHDHLKRRKGYIRCPRCGTYGAESKKEIDNAKSTSN